MLNSGSQLAFQQGTFYIASHFLLSNLLCKSVVAPGSDLKTYLFLDAVADPDTQLGGAHHMSDPDIRHGRPI